MCAEKIEKLPHTKGDWQVKKNFIINSDGTVTDGTEVIVCTVCKQEVENRKYTANLTQRQKNAAICAYEAVNDWHCGPSFLIYTLLADFLYDWIVFISVPVFINIIQEILYNKRFTFFMVQNFPKTCKAVYLLR